MLIQISGLYICERLHPYIGAAIKKVCDFIDRRPLDEDHVIIFCGNVFATRTYLPVEDINFFNRILQIIKKYKTVFALSHDDFHAAGKHVKISYEMYLEAAGIPFIHTPGVHEVHGIKWSYFVDDASTVAPDSYAIFFHGVPEPSAAFRGALCNTQMFINGNVASAGPLVQVHPEEGHQFGFVVWSSQGCPKFLHLDLPIPQLNLTFEKNVMAELPSAKAKRVLAKFSKCSDHFILTARDSIQTKYQCPVEVAEESRLVRPRRDNQHDLNVHLEILRRLYGSSTLFAALSAEYSKTVRIAARTVPTWSIEYLTWDNLFAYRARNFIDFRKISGATFIVGKNKSGKSSIIDILMLVLFDRTVRASKISDAINKNADGRGYVKCGLVIDGARYTIERFFECREKNKKQFVAQKFKLSAAGADISEKTVKETYAKLHAMLPITYEKFKLNIAIQEEKSLITLTPRTKSDLAVFLLGMDYMLEAQEAAAAKKKSLSEQLAAIKEVTGKNTQDRLMVEVESDIARLELKVQEDAGLLATFPNNLHHKIMFTATHNAFMEAVRRRQQLILQGIKPIGAVADTTTMKEDLAKRKLLCDAVGLAGVVGELFRPFMEELESVINKILARISDFCIDIEVKRTGFEIFVKHDMQKIPAAASSGYQKFLIDLVARLVMVTRSPITRCSLIIIDEGFGCLDETNFVKVARAVNILKKYIAIVIITHLDELKSYADKFICVADNAVRFGALSEEEMSQSQDLHEDKKKAA